MKDSEHTRYCGSRPFADTAHDRRIFFGRESEKHALLHLVLARKLVVVFARSGAGKTSLLQAGLMEPLRDRGFLPIRARVNDPRAGALFTVYGGIESTLAGDEDLRFALPPGGRLEAYYGLGGGSTDGLRAPGWLSRRHRRDRQEAGERRLHERPIPLWQFFSEARFWKGRELLTPVLVLDQFEELFTLHAREERQTFEEEIANLAADRVPRHALERETHSGEEPPLDQAPELKILLAIREEHLGSLEELAPRIPGILDDRYRLRGMTREQAREAIVEPAALDDGSGVAGIATESFLYEPEAVDKILDFLCHRKHHGDWTSTDQVEPFQLQLICDHLERVAQRRAPPRRITLDDVGRDGNEGLRRILGEFYHVATQRAAGGGRGPSWARRLFQQRRLRAIRSFCETGLIIDGRRVSTDEAVIRARHGISGEELAKLTDTRLLQRVPRLDSYYYELSHDSLVRPVLKARDERRQRRREWRWRGIAAALAAVLVVLFVVNFRLSSRLDSVEEMIARMPQVETVPEEVAGVEEPAPTDPVLELIRLADRALAPAPDDATSSVDLREALLRMREIDRARLDAEGVRFSAIDAGERRIFDCDGEGLISRWEGAFEAPRRTAIVRQIRRLAISPDGRSFAAARDDRTIGFWDPFGNPLAELATPPEWGEVRVLAFHSVDGVKRVVAADAADRVVTLDPLGTTAAATVDLAAPQRLTALAVDGEAVAAGTSDGEVLLWSWETGSSVLAPAGRFGGAWSPVRSLAFTTDPPGVAAGDDDGFVRLFDAAGNLLLAPIAAHPGPVLALAWSAEDEVLLSRGGDGTLRSWDLAVPSGDAELSASEALAVALKRLCGHSLLQESAEEDDPAALRLRTACEARERSGELTATVPGASKEPRARATFAGRGA